MWFYEISAVQSVFFSLVLMLSGHYNRYLFGSFIFCFSYFFEEFFLDHSTNDIFSINIGCFSTQTHFWWINIASNEIVIHWFQFYRQNEIDWKRNSYLGDYTVICKTGNYCPSYENFTNRNVVWEVCDYFVSILCDIKHYSFGHSFERCHSNRNLL